MGLDRQAVPLAALLLVGGCASRLYERTAVVLDIPDHDQLEVRYEDFDGCLLKQQIPVDYKVKRPRYTLHFETGFGTDGHAPSLAIELSNAPDAEADFPSLTDPPQGVEADGVVRYRVDTVLVRGDNLDIEVKRGTESLGTESIRLRREHCKAMALGE